MKTIPKAIPIKCFRAESISTWHRANRVFLRAQSPRALIVNKCEYASMTLVKVIIICTLIIYKQWYAAALIDLNFNNVAALLWLL